MFEGSRALRSRLLPSAAGGRRRAERIDERRPHQLLGSRADQRARPGAVDGIRSHGLPAAGADRREVLEPARGGAQRAAAELREPPVRPRRHGDRRRRCIPPDHPYHWLTIGARRRHPRGAHRRRARVLPALLPSAQRVAGARRRHRPEAALALAEQYFGEIPGGGEARRGDGASARTRRPTTSGSCSRIASSCRGSISRGIRRRSSPTATPSWISSPKCCRTGRRRACIARSSTNSASPPKSRRRRTRARPAASSRSWRRPRPAARSPRSSARSPRRSPRSSSAGPTAGELERCLAQAEAHFLFRLQTVGGFGGKSDQLNAYNIFLGEPGYFPRDLSRYRSATAASLQHAAAALCCRRQRVVLSVVPRGRLALALEASKPVVGLVTAADRSAAAGPRSRTPVPVSSDPAPFVAERAESPDGRTSPCSARQRAARGAGGRIRRPRRPAGAGRDHRRHAR